MPSSAVPTYIYRNEHPYLALYVLKWLTKEWPRTKTWGMWYRHSNTFQGPYPGALRPCFNIVFSSHALLTSATLSYRVGSQSQLNCTRGTAQETFWLIPLLVVIFLLQLMFVTFSFLVITCWKWTPDNEALLFVFSIGLGENETLVSIIWIVLWY